MSGGRPTRPDVGSHRVPCSSHWGRAALPWGRATAHQMRSRSASTPQRCAARVVGCSLRPQTPGRSGPALRRLHRAGHAFGDVLPSASGCDPTARLRRGIPDPSSGAPFRCISYPSGPSSHRSIAVSAPWELEGSPVNQGQTATLGPTLTFVSQRVRSRTGSRPGAVDISKNAVASARLVSADEPVREHATHRIRAVRSSLTEDCTCPSTHRFRLRCSGPDHPMVSGLDRHGIMALVGLVALVPSMRRRR